MSCCKYKPHTDSLFCDDLIIKEGSFDDNLYREYLVHSVKWIEDYIVDKIIGRCIYDNLYELICNGEIDNEENHCYAELRDYLLPIYIYGLKSELPMVVTYQQRNQGLVKSSDPNGTFEVASPSEISTVVSNYKSKMNYYINRVTNFIMCCGCFNGYNCCCPCLNSSRSLFGISLNETSPRYIAGRYSRYYKNRCRCDYGCY